MPANYGSERLVRHAHETVDNAGSVTLPWPEQTHTGCAGQHANDRFAEISYSYRAACRPIASGGPWIPSGHEAGTAEIRDRVTQWRSLPLRLRAVSGIPETVESVHESVY